MFAGRFDPGFQLQLHRVQSRRDLVAEPCNQGVLAPFGSGGQCRERRARLAGFADAFERLVVAVFDQRVEAGGLAFVVEQVAAEDLQQARLGHERRQRQEHEVAFRTLPAPAVGGLGPVILKLRLQLENTSKYVAPVFANARVTASSEYGRSNEK